MIIINEPKITKHNKKVVLSAKIEINDTEKDLWLEFDNKFAKYLIKDRCDAFLIALLPIALRQKKDIICNSTVSEELLHNLRNQLIPTLSKSGHGFYKTRISADYNKKVIPNAGAVGTGLALGIDSFHVISRYIEPEYSSIKLTHVCINDFVEAETESSSEIKNPLIAKAIELAQELELSYIHIKTNLLSDFDVDYKRDHIYCNLFPVFAIQKLFKIYLTGSSGWDYNYFSVKNCDKRDGAFYGLLLKSALSTSTLKFYPEGGERNSLEKIEDVMHFAPAQRYLHSCALKNEKNCNKCYKCMRTMLTLDALDRLDYFSLVYDIEYYRKNKCLYLSYLEKCHDKGDKYMEPVYKLFEKKKMLTCSPPKAHINGIILPEKINTSSLILKRLNDGNIILSKQTREFLPAVVVAKIIATLLALESGKTQLVVDLPDGFLKGVSRVSIYDLINIMLLSQNQSITEIIAQEIAGSEQEFVEEMNAKLKELNIHTTRFSNVNGFGENNYTTAEDTVKIVEHALKNQHFNKIFKTSGYSFYSDEEKNLATVNLVLKPGSEYYVPECTGAKYGVQGILSNHIALFEKDNKKYLLVLLGIKDPHNEYLRFSEVKNIIDCVL